MRAHLATLQPVATLQRVATRVQPMILTRRAPLADCPESPDHSQRIGRLPDQYPYRLIQILSAEAGRTVSTHNS
jgi:hypothetical protein